MAPFIDGDAKNGGQVAPEPGRLCQIVTPVGNLGYGFVESQIFAELEKLASVPTPTAIILDAGSTDSGPSRLALGITAAPRGHYVRDLGKLLKLVTKYKVPLMFSSAGGDGSDEHVDLMVDVIRELAELPENKSYKLKVVSVYATVANDRVSKRFQAGDIVGCGPCVPALKQEDIDATPRIVAQMGPEPILQAMVANPDFDVMVVGRAYDPAPYIAFAAYHALKKTSTDLKSLSKETLGSFVHMGKILECGGSCARPKSQAASAYLYDDNSFDIIPLDPLAACVPLSVAAHTLYEKTRPDVLHGPGGYMDLTKTSYEQLADGRTVRVRGATFEAYYAQGERYTVKLEGARLRGYRTIFIGSFIDPILVSQLDSVITRIKEYVAFQHKHITEKWDFDFHVYGRDENWNPSAAGVGGRPYAGSKGIFIVGEAVAESQHVATSICASARIGCVHAPYQGQKATSGNFGFGLGGKNELETGPCTEFCVYHLMSLAEGEEGAVAAETHEAGIANTVDGKPLFHWTTVTVGKGEAEDPAAVPAVASTNGGSSTKRDNAPPLYEVAPLPEHPRFLADVAPVVRSKNSGPYEITVDILFSTPDVYELVKASGILTTEVVAKLYGLKVEEMVWCGFFDQALAFKATFPRKRNGRMCASGGFLENDMHGSQQYMNLMELPLGEELEGKLAKVLKTSG
ncbi:caib baif family enzyme [Cladophialophora carrionii]|uniref:Caib baif family enzyme n=1 Tax=Cladophialophora carrionii TaxID=86049 RepID=A0A1C1CKQ8_9EURO|nr:caib baif family enzyme [Cladophialophora carrionii]